MSKSMSNCFVLSRLGCRREKIDRQQLARFRNCGGQGTIIHDDTRHVRKRGYLHLFFSLRHFKRSLLCDTAAMKSSTSLFFSFVCSFDSSLCSSRVYLDWNREYLDKNYFYGFFFLCFLFLQSFGVDTHQESLDMVTTAMTQDA